MFMSNSICAILPIPLSLHISPSVSVSCCCESPSLYIVLLFYCINFFNNFLQAFDFRDFNFNFDFYLAVADPTIRFDLRVFNIGDNLYASCFEEKRVCFVMVTRSRLKVSQCSENGTMLHKRTTAWTHSCN